MNDELQQMIADMKACSDWDTEVAPSVPDMLFMTHKTWMTTAKQAIKEGIAIEYRPYLHARRFRFIGGIPVRIYNDAEEGKIFAFNAPQPRLSIMAHPTIYTGWINW